MTDIHYNTTVTWFKIMQTCRDIRYQQYQRKYHHWEKETSLIVETGDVERREKTRHSQREKFKKKIHNKGKISALCSEQSYDNCFDVTWYMFKNLDLIVCYFEQRRVNLNPWHCSMKQVLLIGCVLVLDTEIPLNFLTIQLLKRQKALNK